MSAGASKQEWDHWSIGLGLTDDLLPIVNDPAAPPAPGSSVKQFGKVPSTYTYDDCAQGLKGWQDKFATQEEVDRWSEDGRYSIGLHARLVRGIDIDVTDQELVDEIKRFIQNDLSITLPTRYRDNSPKCLLMFKMTGNHKKSVIPTRAGKIEFLFESQQMVVQGNHPSQVPYLYEGGTPTAIPELHPDVFEGLREGIQDKFGVEPAKATPTETTATAESTVVLTDIDVDALSQLRSALQWKELRDSVGGYTEWSAIGLNLISLGELGRELWLEFNVSAANPNPGAETPESWWAKNASTKPDSDYNSIFAKARSLNWSMLKFEVVPKDPSERPTIIIEPGTLDTTAERCEDILKGDLFTRGGSSLVRVAGGAELKDSEGVRRDAASEIILPVSQEYVRRRLPKHARLVKYNAKLKQLVPVDCPPELARNIVEQGHWPNLRNLIRIARARFVRPDGTICETPGYDAPTGMLYHPNAIYPLIRAAPSKADAEAALQELTSPFDQFPFASGASLSALIANILTECARPAIDCSPLTFFDAQYAGTGKTLLSKAPALIVHGTEPTFKPWPSSEDELRKSLFSSALAGDSSVTFDNTPNGGKIRSPYLCFASTAVEISDRILGVSKSPKVPNKITLGFTGNNVTPTGDLARRSIVVRLDPNVDLPTMRARQFRILDFKAYILKHRATLLVAALTIIRAYRLSGAKGKTPMPSFEEWSRFVRDPLIWLGMDDPVDTQATGTDEETGQLAHAFALLAESPIGATQFTALELADHLALHPPGPLLDALESAGCRNDKKSASGYWLRSAKDKIAGGFKLLQFLDHNGPTRWGFRRIESIGAVPKARTQTIEELFGDLL